VKKLARIAGRVGHRIHGDRSKSIEGAGWEFVHVCIDDASRLVYAEVLSDEKGITTVLFLQRALAWYRQHGIKVERILTDNGANYRSHVFRLACLRRSIRQLYTRPYRPRTNGKAERFIQTMLREWAYARPYKHSRLRTRALNPWLRYYNQRRPHGSLDGKPPISRLRQAREQRA
jgi:transposase InsO family protein